MPKGHHIPNMMDNEVARLFYACLKHHEGSINYQAVAAMLGFKDAAFAKKRLQRVMKAQEKTGPPCVYGDGNDRNSPGAAGKHGRPAKKRKRDTDAEEQDESQGEVEGGKDARQLHQSPNDLDEEEEKV